ncbi:MAG: hypothetical protein KF810_13670 [Rhizobiaceae bacterium]|nr:hypothetical protein [Rhizobiaceae bacterium]
MNLSVQSEIPALELPLAEGAPLGENDRLTVVRSHCQGVAMQKVSRQHEECGAI